MYKVLLCWRYLRTRYLALACIISVMLGVATLIVVNSVMTGFSTKLRERLHDLCSDVLIEAASLEGFGDPNGKMEQIRKDPELAGKIAAMTPTLETFAMIQFYWPNGEMITKPIRLIGVEPEGRAAIGGFSNFLKFQKNQTKPSFEVSEDAKQRYEWRLRALMQPAIPQAKIFPDNFDTAESVPQPVAPTPSTVKIPRGAIVGNLIASFRLEDEKQKGKYDDYYVLHPGDPIYITTVSGAKLAPVNDSFLVVDYFTSEMSEYDSNCVFVPLDYLQHLRTMEGRVTSIQISVKDHHDARLVCDRLKQMFSEKSLALNIVTWEDKQGAILQAIEIEKGILNVLLFLIIGVAGFGILAIFSMIVAEKTRDIGVLKALGASNGGVMKIFVSYGFLLGLIGTLIGTSLGVWLTENINEVEQWLSMSTGQQIFNRKVYYFDKIPTDIQAGMVLLVNIGAVTIAVVFSVLPAMRAAFLHPVRALRYE
ncbi:MAG TPA: FtsX-like permease family protein [Gemmataceae bacterium]|nr:FtsX-like permease family protein [Gemmataceae bacterium]